MTHWNVPLERVVPQGERELGALGKEAGSKVASAGWVTLSAHLGAVGKCAVDVVLA